MNDEFVARELIKIATLLIEARVDVQARYNHWNQVVFDGKLPAVPVKWGRSKRWGGICRGTIDRMNHTGTVRVIEVSDFIVDDPKVIDGIILHEMIHAYMYLQGKGGHGWEFGMLRREFSTKAGMEIPATEDIEHFIVPEDMEAAPKGVMVMESDTRKGLVVYNLNFFKRSFDAIKGYSDALASYYRLRGSKMKATFLISEVKDLLKYPEKRTVMRGTYTVPESLLDQVLSTGQVLAQVVA